MYELDTEQSIEISYPSLGTFKNTNIQLLGHIIQSVSVKTASKLKSIFISFTTKHYQPVNPNYPNKLYFKDLFILPYEDGSFSFYGIHEKLKIRVVRNFSLGLFICYLSDIPLEVYCTSRIAFFLNSYTEYIVPRNPSLGKGSTTGFNNFYMVIDTGNTLDMDGEPLYPGDPSLKSPFLNEGALYNSITNKQLKVLGMI